MRKNLIIAFYAISFNLFAQNQDFSRIDSLFVEWDNLEVPGGAIGIIQDDELIYSKGFGSADLEHNIPITPSSVFYIGSISKQFVTFSILLLEEQGKLALDDPIQKYLPDFPEYGSLLTIRNFIHHTSGVRDYLTLMYLKGRNYLDNADVDEVYELIKRQEVLNFTPGEKYLYSNSCYFMLAMIIEKAAGKSLKAYAQEEIFEPLGMKSSLFYDDNRDLIKNRVFSYEKKNGSPGFYNLISRFDLVGSGGVYSSVEDLLLWDQNFYANKLGKGGQAIIDKMHEDGLLNDGESSGYAFAIVNGTYKGLKTVSHGGALAGYRAQLVRFPDEKFSVIILANRGDAKPTSMAYKISDILLEDKLKDETEEKKNETRKKKKIKKIKLEQTIGNYEIEPGIILKVTLKNDSLQVLQSWNKETYAIELTETNTYQIPEDNSIQFVFSDLQNDSAQILTVFQNGRETVCKRKEDIDVSKINFEEYSGKFYSSELEVTYIISLKGESLELKVPHNDQEGMTILDVDQFTSGFGLIRFERLNDQVVSFKLDAGRVTGLVFEKLN